MWSQSHVPEEKDDRLLAVLEIAKTLMTETDGETLLPKLLTGLMAMLKAADAGVLLLHNPSDDRLDVKAAQGYDLNVLKQSLIAPGEGIGGKAFQTGRAELYPTPETITKATAAMTSTRGELLTKAILGTEPPQSALCVPLIAGGTKVGALILENRRQPNAFVPADLALLQQVADLIAPAIQSRTEETAHSPDEMDRVRTELISSLAHEMRTPLTSIKGYSTALLMEEATFSAETQREFLQIIDEECDVLQNLIHDLLESSTIDAGFLRLEFQPVALPSLAQSMTDDFARRSQQHRFMVDFPKEFPIVEADPDRIAQVLRNLLDNAVKYSPGGGLIIVRGEVRRNEVIISVADQGIGIAPEHLNRLFERFYRVKSGLGHHVVGSGLGLPIARTMVESHGGRIWAESRVGHGSTFYFTLPLRGSSQTPAEVKEPSNG